MCKAELQREIAYKLGQLAAIKNNPRKPGQDRVLSALLSGMPYRDMGPLEDGWCSGWDSVTDESR